MPDPSVFTPLTLQMLGSLPPQLRDSVDYQAVQHALARELALLQSRIETVRAQFNPRTADGTLLKGWEALLRLTVEPVGQTVAQRRATVIAMLQRLRTSPAGSDWEAAVTRLLGAGWTYQEHVEGDATTPPAYTIRVKLPYPPSGNLYPLTLRLLRDITPAHLDIQLQYTGGMVWDESQWDQAGWG